MHRLADRAPVSTSSPSHSKISVLYVHLPVAEALGLVIQAGEVTQEAVVIMRVTTIKVIYLGTINLSHDVQCHSFSSKKCLTWMIMMVGSLPWIP